MGPFKSFYYNLFNSSNDIMFRAISARSADLESEKEKGRIILTKTNRYRKGSFSNSIKNNNDKTKLSLIKNENTKIESKIFNDNINETMIKNLYFEKVDMAIKKENIQISSLEEKIIGGYQTKKSTRLIVQEENNLQNELNNTKIEPMIYIPKKLRENSKPTESFNEEKIIKKQSFEQKTEKIYQAKQIIAESYKKDLMKALFTSAQEKIEDHTQDEKYISTVSEPKILEANCINTDDDVDEEKEFENWKQREIYRLKRDHKENVEFQKTKYSIKEFENKETQQLTKDHIHMKFLQKYYHKGAFFSDRSR